MVGICQMQVLESYGLGLGKMRAKAFRRNRALNGSMAGLFRAREVK